MSGKDGKLLTLATPCAACPHPYNWHTSGGCQQDDGVTRCGCLSFAVPADVRTRADRAAKKGNRR